VPTAPETDAPTLACLQPNGDVIAAPSGLLAGLTQSRSQAVDGLWGGMVRREHKCDRLPSRALPQAARRPPLDRKPAEVERAAEGDRPGT
jgi:hypothetical protein